jgi:hypothetical protein
LGRHDLDLFLESLCWLAEQELAFEPTNEEDVGPTITSEGLKGAFYYEVEPDELARLFHVFQLENWGWLNINGSPKEWSVTVGPEIWRFRNVRTIDDFLAIRHEWEKESKKIIYIAPFGDDSFEISGYEATSATNSYVDLEVVSAICSKEPHSPWACNKLLCLIDELDSNYASGHAYAVHALLRTILDHVPPIFGQQNFEGVANNYSWGKTDKAYMKKLLDFKLQGDDALHRQASQHRDLLSIEDVPPRTWINRLLQECAKQL